MRFKEGPLSCSDQPPKTLLGRKTPLIVIRMGGRRKGASMVLLLWRVRVANPIIDDAPVLDHDATPASQGKTFVVSRQDESRTMGLLDFQQ